MDMSQFASDHLRKEDVATPRVLTIAGISTKKYEEDDEPKALLHFRETNQTLVLNRTNTLTLIDAFGTSNSDAWVNQPIELYKDDTVTMRGKIVGGIRIRMPQFQPPAVHQEMQRPPWEQNAGSGPIIGSGNG